ncbi:hypothetical protein EJB05_29451 [Eragrostis curvula]|uniref:Uncharacterized protein n=1 Tax=Eragrostis curvula TaxID=38414 RepID=A0A5J9UV39_9POAL|nr:hypothetical protein EJB05_29451 [Eragrostis curvula]
MKVSFFSFNRNIEIKRQDAMQMFSSMCRRRPTLLTNWCFIQAVGEMVKGWRKLGEIVKGRRKLELQQTSKAYEKPTFV